MLRQIGRLFTGVNFSLENRSKLTPNQVLTRLENSPQEGGNVPRKNVQGRESSLSPDVRGLDGRSRQLRPQRACQRKQDLVQNQAIGFGNLKFPRPDPETDQGAQVGREPQARSGVGLEVTSLYVLG